MTDIGDFDLGFAPDDDAVVKQAIGDSARLIVGAHEKIAGTAAASIERGRRNVDQFGEAIQRAALTLRQSGESTIRPLSDLAGPEAAPPAPDICVIGPEFLDLVDWTWGEAVNSVATGKVALSWSGTVNQI